MFDLALQIKSGVVSQDEVVAAEGQFDAARNAVVEEILHPTGKGTSFEFGSGATVIEPKIEVSAIKITPIDEKDANGYSVRGHMVDTSADAEFDSVAKLSKYCGKIDKLTHGVVSQEALANFILETQQKANKATFEAAKNKVGKNAKKESHNNKIDAKIDKIWAKYHAQLNAIGIPTTGCFDVLRPLH